MSRHNKIQKELNQTDALNKVEMYNKIKYKSTWKEVEYFNCKIEELQLKEDKRQNDMEIAAKNLDKVTEEYRNLVSVHSSALSLPKSEFEKLLRLFIQALQSGKSKEEIADLLKDEQELENEAKEKERARKQDSLTKELKKIKFTLERVKIEISEREREAHKDIEKNDRKN